ncbi:MAG: TonB-dependent receptor plug domain-containing protein, partial [Pseudomonadales bacterium]|nr:TonB-dependent receptor plug domain-containing protein [Pseudomonadales bacterium]
MFNLALKPFLSMALTFSVTIANADNNEPSRTRILSLAELLKVDIVSKKPERVMDAPAVVSVYQASHLKAMGMRNLRDFITFIPGFIVNETLLGNNPIQIRGISDANNQKVLFLLNGVPYWMPSHGDIPINGIPFEAIERIEVIRGPGSVIYGTNASAGVINIITRQDDEAAVFLQAGSNDLLNGNITMGWKKEGFGHITLSAEVNDETYDAEVTRAISGFDPVSISFVQDLSGSYAHKTQYASVLVEGAYQGFSFMLQNYRSERTGGFNGSILPFREMLYEGSLVHAAYEFVALHGQWLVFADYNPFYQNSEITDMFALSGVAGDGRIGSNKNDGNYRSRIVTNYRYEAEQWELLTGLEYELRSVGEYVFADTDGGATL